jgi:hypothetical protein
LVLFVRRLGPAATVLPWCAFYLATRSQDGYYLMMTPLWLAAAITVPLSEFANAWQPRPRWLRGPRRRPALVGAVVLLVLPALMSATLAVTGGPPLRMDVAGVRRGSGNSLTALTLRVTNTGSDPLSPHYMFTTGQGMSRYWTVARGPATVPAHGTATVELWAPTGRFVLPAKKSAPFRLRAFTANPQTLSTRDVRRAELGLKG